MEGVLWGSIAGVAFGLFQVTSRRANSGGVDPFLATFAIILTSFVVLSVFAVALEQPSELLAAPVSALLSFALAGLSNFFLGWTFMVLAQQRLGAARTSVVAGTAPLFGTGIAFLTLGQSVLPLALVGVVLVVVGVGLLSGSSAPAEGGNPRGARSGVGFALLTAISWGATAVFARHGLDQVAAPLSGVSVGMAASAALYGIGLVWRRVRGREARAPLSRETRVLLVITGVLVASALGTQWIALGLAPVAVVLALNQLAVPVVLLIAPAVTGLPAERLTRQSILGAAIVVGGTLLIILARGGAAT